MEIYVAKLTETSEDVRERSKRRGESRASHERRR